jgi:hypothetical protein
MRLDRVKRHHNGILSAEITVVSGADPLARSGHIHHSQLSNLLGPRVRSDAVRALVERIPDLPWSDLIEQALEHVIQQMRQGKPVVALADVSIAERPRWQLAPILRQGQPTVLFGYGGSMKSYLAQYWATRLALGMQAESANVLVLDWESTEQEWGERQAMICSGLGVPLPTNIHYRACAESLPNDVDDIQQAIGEYQAEVILIDSAAYACGDEPEKAGPTMDFFRALRALQCTSLIIAHQSSDSKALKPFGSVFWENSARSTIQVLRSDESNEVMTIGLFNRKVNAGRRFEPYAVQAQFHVFDEQRYTPGDSVTFNKGKLATIPDLAERSTSADKILSWLMEHGPSTNQAIEDGAGVKGIAQVLKRMAEKNLVMRDPGGRNVLPDNM